jgi:hypothetical protein
MLRWRTGVLVGAAVLVASATLVVRLAGQRPAAIPLAVWMKRSPICGGPSI